MNEIEIEELGVLLTVLKKAQKDLDDYWMKKFSEWNTEKFMKTVKGK